MNREMRMMLLGAVLGLTVAVVPSCQKPCKETCAGCCDAKDQCQTGADDGACGTKGGKCSACGSGSFCSENVCKAGQRCSPDNCAGCCDEAGACVSPVTATQCGTGGNACTACESGLLCDAGTCVSPFRCKQDNDCHGHGDGTICNVSTGECVPGRGCSSDQECQISNDSDLDDGGAAIDDPCFRGGIGCRCDQRDAPPASNGFTYTGTCRQRIAPCVECANDTECGQSVVFEYPEGRGLGKCKALPGDTTNKKYCLLQRNGACACGTVDDGTGYCKPQTNSCQQVGCNVDKDCAAGSVCSVNNPDAGAGSCGGVCKPRCKWDFLNKQLISPGCGPTETCWVDSANLDPNSKFYGAGRCQPACQTDNDCKLSAANPFGGNNLKCEGELLAGGGRDNKRCRADGECMDSLECPEKPNNQPYLGYCDRASLSCKSDCRVGLDPSTDRPYKDCRDPYACAADAGSRICRLLNCSEQGGALAACSRGEMCAFEDRNGDGTPELRNVPQALQKEDGCFEAPRVPGPYCHQCDDDNGCKTLQAESWFTCANGAKNPSCSLLPPKCMQIGGVMNPNSVCGIPTLNDYSANNGAARGCPQGYNVVIVPHGETDGDADLCTTDADCSSGTADAGSCALEPRLKRQDGGVRKACRCTAGQGGQCPTGALKGGTCTELGTSCQNANGNFQCLGAMGAIPTNAPMCSQSMACPSGFTCFNTGATGNRCLKDCQLDGGFTLTGPNSVCLDGVSGARTYCIETIVCIPQKFAYQGVADAGLNYGALYGCGLTPKM